jgi:hypothetical protein
MRPLLSYVSLVAEVNKNSANSLSVGLIYLSLGKTIYAAAFQKARSRGHLEQLRGPWLHYEISIIMKI